MDRNFSYIDVPCSNSFQVLADLDNSADVSEREDDVHTPPPGSYPLCYICGYYRSTHNWLTSCAVCDKYMDDFDELNTSGRLYDEE